MSGRAELLAARFEVAHHRALGIAGSLSEAEWAVVVPGENWTVRAVLHHVAAGYELGKGWLERARLGEEVTTSPADLDERNEQLAREADALGSEAVLAELATRGRALGELLAGLSDDELDRTFAFGPAGGAALPVERLAAAMTGHVEDHLAHATEALGR